MEQAIGNSIILTLQRGGFHEDCRIIIHYRPDYNSYVVRFYDPVLFNKTCNYTKTLVFYEYDVLCEYLDLFFENLINDCDDSTTQFTHITYDIPGFTQVLVPMSNFYTEDGNCIDSNYFQEYYTTFAKCVDFFFEMVV